MICVESIFCCRAAQILSQSSSPPPHLKCVTQLCLQVWSAKSPGPVETTAKSSSPNVWHTSALQLSEKSSSCTCRRSFRQAELLALPPRLWCQLSVSGGSRAGVKEFHFVIGSLTGFPARFLPVLVQKFGAHASNSQKKWGFFVLFFFFGRINCDVIEH